MRLIVNGENLECAAPDLAGLLLELGHDEALVATALNADFVPRAARRHTRLSENDAVEIVSPMQGG
ncbi:sulfur carrier protein ThiS [Aureimonas altamirensis]|uniref:sulfur carrier protein ThiS n=1 Tax=Aureimonas altamirensis TaxID=370622 RepID=UPI0020372F80|nr:sulfur carrier protein ThiS [Aureimonas altamirensis]MCM2503743.1 sulfur carrier protein ThiS [Aureimonas altamirensis]